MEKKVLLKQLVDTGTNLRKQIISKVRVSDEGVYPIGELWDANTTLDIIVNGAHEQHDTIRELDAFAHQIDVDLKNEINRAKAAEQDLDDRKANKVDVYTKDEVYNKQEIDDIVGEKMQIVDQYAIYSFVSYSSISGARWAEGRAQLTGVVSGSLTQVIVLENTEESFVGQKFFIPSNAEADGETKYTLYNAEKEDTGIQVTILKESDTTYKDATIKEYIDFMFTHAGGGYSGQVPFDSVGSSQIIDNSIAMDDLSDEIKDKLKVTVDEDGENATFGQ